MSDFYKLTGRDPERGSGGRAAAPPPLDRRKVALSILLMVVGAAATGLLVAMALLLLLVTDGCTLGANDCNPDLFALGFFVALLGPPVVSVIGFVTTAVFLHRRHRRPWAVPVVGLAASVVAWLIGAALCFASVPGYDLADYIRVLASVIG